MITSDSRVPDGMYYPVSGHRMTRGEGVYLYDAPGRDCIGCAAAAFSLSLGYSHPGVVAAVQSWRPCRSRPSGWSASCRVSEAGRSTSWSTVWWRSRRRT